MVVANELRIGNIVSCPFIGTVDTIEQGSAYIAPNKLTEMNVKAQQTSYDMICGIPLTEEWLLFRFPDDGSTMELFGGYDIWFERNGNNLYLKTETSSRLIEFVHTAQNICFALTGSELTLKPEQQRQDQSPKL